MNRVVAAETWRLAVIATVSLINTHKTRTSIFIRQGRSELAKRHVADIIVHIAGPVVYISVA